MLKITYFRIKTKPIRDLKVQTRKRGARGRLLGVAMILTIAACVIHSGDSSSSHTFNTSPHLAMLVHRIS